MKKYRSLCLSIIIALISFGFSISTFAAEQTVFGPKQFVRTKGKPNTYTETFAAMEGGVFANS